MTPGPVFDSSPGAPSGSALDAKLNIVFAGDEPNLVFVEVETPDGKSVRAGEWQEGRDDLSYLTITPRGILKALGLSEDPEVLSCAYCGFQYQGDQGVTREILTNHIEDCPEHPMGKRLRELTEAAKEAARYYTAGELEDSDVAVELSRLDEVVERVGTKRQADGD